MIRECKGMEGHSVYFQEEDELTLGIEGEKLYAFGKVPEGAGGVVVIAHGSGSSRFSVRDQKIAKNLYEKGFGVFLMDLLTTEEEKIDNLTRELRFDIMFLGRRLTEVADWLQETPPFQGLKIGYFGASTGAAAALVAAAKKPSICNAVVSRGGRPDLAGGVLNTVQAPTLLIVGGNDAQVIDLNKMALKELTCQKELEIVPGATHLFEEPGAMEKVAELTQEWFLQHL